MQVAGELFYARGLRAVGIDEIIAKSGAAKATLYAHFPTKDELIAAYLQQRSDAWREHLGTTLETYADRPRERIDAIFRVLAEGCGADDFRGCPFINAAAEYPDPRHPARLVVAAQQQWVWALFRDATRQARLRQPEAIADQLVLLYNSALVGSQLTGTTKPATRAREAARVLVAASGMKSR